MSIIFWTQVVCSVCGYRGPITEGDDAVKARLEACKLGWRSLMPPPEELLYDVRRVGDLCPACVVASLALFDGQAGQKQGSADSAPDGAV